MKKFIAFEGIDGSGKSTQLKLLLKSFKKAKINFLSTREPGGTLLSEDIRKILVNKKNYEISPHAELLLFYAARYEHVKKIILPTLKKKIVVCDRYFYSTYCYQILAGKVSIKNLNYLHKNFAFNLMPDITIILNIEAEKAIKRSLNIKKSETRFELRDKKFHKIVSVGFESLSSRKKVKIFDGNLDENIIHENIIDFLNKQKITEKKIPYYY
jgi:dTMP kinase